MSSLYGSELDHWGYCFSRPNLRALSLRPDDLLTILKMALSIGFGNSVSLLPAIQAKRLLTFASVGLSPTEHTCLSWSRFRTAGFPQYGWKVGLSGSAFPHIAQVKPAPGIPCSTRRFASALRALRCPTLRPALCRDDGLGDAPPFEELAPLPQRSSLRSGFYCPSPSTLNRPHPPHS